MKSRKKFIFWGIIAVIIIICLYSYFSDDGEKIDYLTEEARIGSIHNSVSATGEIAAQVMVDVGAQVSGQITKLYVYLGQEVKQGDMIAEIDSTTQENELSTNKARLETYKAQLVARKISLKVSKQQYDREVNLYKNKATSNENLENAQNTYASASASVDEMESLIRQQQIAVSTSEINLGYTKISAPIDGVIVSVPVEAGQTVNSNQTTPTIVKVADLSQMEIKVEISEGDITKVKPGMPVEFTILSAPDKIYFAKLDSIDPGLTTLTDGKYGNSSSSSSSSSTTAAVYYYGKLIVPNTDGILRIGMTTQSEITIAQVSDVLIIPNSVIHKDGSEQFVLVLEPDGFVKRSVIKTGLSDSMNTEVLSGVNVGDMVISSQMSASEMEKASSMVRMRRGPRV